MSEFPNNDLIEKTLSEKLVSSAMMLLPWLIVGTLLWAGVYVKPSVSIEKVKPSAIGKRDRFYGVDITPNNEIYIAGNYGKILKSQNSGKSWLRLETNIEKHLQDISAWDKSKLVAVGNDGVIITTEDGGETWDKADAPKSEIANRLLKVHCYPNGEAWAVGEGGMIIQSMDYGKTWVVMRDEIEDVIFSDVVKLNSGEIIVVGEYGRVLKSTGKKKWDEVTIENSNSSLTAISTNTDGDILAVGLDGVMISSTDAGKTWRLVSGNETGNIEHLLGISWSDDLDSWAVVGNKGLWIEVTASLKKFKISTLSPTELLDHTSVQAVNKKGLYVGGANIGLLDLDEMLYTVFDK